MPPRLAVPSGIAHLASTQYGLTTAAQLADAGVDRKAVMALTRTGVLTRVERNVYAFCGSPTSFRQRAMRTVLTIGGDVAVSHGSAACLWGFDELGIGQIDVTVGPDRHLRRAGVAVRRRSLPRSDTTSRHGIPVTTPPRVIADLSPGPWATGLLSRLTDHFFHQRVLSPRELIAAMDHLHWHPGHDAMWRVVDRHLEGALGNPRPADNDWERSVREAVLAAGLPPPIEQHEVVLEHRTAWIDLAIPSLMVAIEFDGYDTHRLRTRFDDDRRRTDDLTDAGWRVVLITAAMGAAEIGRRVGRAIDAQRQKLGVS